MRAVTFTLLPAIALAAKNAVPSLWDGSCYYPRPDIGFDLNSYLGRWYQVAGTIAPFSAECKCTFAQYALNVSPPTYINLYLSQPPVCLTRSRRTTEPSVSIIHAKWEVALSTF